jgi:hypothetical protein
MPATTQQLPKPMGFGPFAAPSWCQATPKTFFPDRLNKVSSTAIVSAESVGSSRATIRSAKINPAASPDQRAWVNNRCARL